MHARLLSLAFVFVLACARPAAPRAAPPRPEASADLIALEQTGLARLAEVRAVEERRAVLVAHMAGRDDHDLRIELEGTENRLFRARQIYDEAAAAYDAALARSPGVVDPATHVPLAPLAYIPFRTDATPFVAPAIAGRVNDLAGKLTPAQRRTLDAELERFDRNTTNEIAVLVIPSLGGHTIEEAALVTANAWKLGKRGADNGVLLLIAVEDRRVRIQTGRGVEEKLTDLQAHDIIESIKPALAAGDWFDALVRGVTAIEKTLAP